MCRSHSSRFVTSFASHGTARSWSRTQPLGSESTTRSPRASARLGSGFVPSGGLPIDPGWSLSSSPSERPHRPADRLPLNAGQAAVEREPSMQNPLPSGSASTAQDWVGPEQTIAVGPALVDKPMPSHPVPSGVTWRCGRPLLRPGHDGFSTLSFSYQEGVLASCWPGKRAVDETCGPRSDRHHKLRGGYALL